MRCRGPIRALGAAPEGSGDPRGCPRTVIDRRCRWAAAAVMAGPFRGSLAAQWGQPTLQWSLSLAPVKCDLSLQPGAAALATASEDRLLAMAARPLGISDALLTRLTRAVR